MQELLTELTNYQPANELEQKHYQKVIDFLKTNQNQFRRENLAGHIVGGAFLLSPDFKKVLFTHHEEYNRWLQLGGHADGEENILNVALREAEEESGISGIKPFNENIFDVDAHFIPKNERKNEPEHYHYEIRYVLVAPTTDYSISNESNALKWFSVEEMEEYQWGDSISRMVKKWKKAINTEDSF